MSKNLELELQHIGLDEREAKVYLAALELGPSPVQKIAQRAQVPRATTYLVLDDLKAKGLVTTYDEGKKTYFVVESPDTLEGLVAERERQVKEQKDLIKNLVPELLQRGQYEKGERPTVRYYEGPKGFHSYMRDILSAPGDEILSIFSNDDTEDVHRRASFSWDDVVKRRKQTKTKKRRGIITWRKTAPSGRHKPDPKFLHYVPYKELPVTADIDIKGNFVGIMPYGATIRCVMIEDAAIANALRIMFNVMWQHYRPEESD